VEESATESLSAFPIINTRFVVVLVVVADRYFPVGLPARCGNGLMTTASHDLCAQVHCHHRYMAIQSGRLVPQLPDDLLAPSWYTIDESGVGGAINNTPPDSDASM
jgi:hypothetical protein